MSELRFGIYILQDAPFPALAERWRRAEEWGFDCIYVADHARDFRNLFGPWFDGWMVLAALAQTTQRARVGILVSNPILRAPAVLAKQAVTVDHLSQGRLELGVGTGIAGFDHAAVGIDYWPPKERARRFREYIEIVDGLLRSSTAPYSFHGRYYQTHDTALAPAPLQHPRLPITVGGQSPTALKAAADLADCWNTHGPFGHSYEQILEITRKQNRWLDESCAAAGRDPAALRRSLLLFDALDAWADADSFERIVEDFREVGMTEFVVLWPEDDEVPLFEHAIEEVIPRLRQGGHASAVSATRGV